MAAFTSTKSVYQGEQGISNDLVSSVETCALAISTGWQFTSLVCTVSGAGTSATPSTLSTSVVASAITLGAGGSATCTYTNTQQGTITIVKNTVGGNATFSYTGTLPSPAVAGAFNIATSNGTGSQSLVVFPSTNYTVTEADPSVTPGGWIFGSLTCTTGG